MFRQYVGLGAEVGLTFLQINTIKLVIIDNKEPYCFKYSI